MCYNQGLFQSDEPWIFLFAQVCSRLHINCLYILYTMALPYFAQHALRVLGVVFKKKKSFNTNTRQQTKSGTNRNSIQMFLNSNVYPQLWLQYPKVLDTFFWKYTENKPPVEAFVVASETSNTDQQKNTFQNAIEIYTCSGVECCPKHDVAFRFSLS